MITGLLALITLIFGGGNTEYFFFTDFDKSINKYVDDKDRKKELQAHLKDYQKAVKEYNKQYKSQLNNFKEKNLDKKTPKQDYLDFFEEFISLRKERQTKAIEFRLSIQQLITDDEWQNIESAGKKATSKALEKVKKKEEKKDKATDQELIQSMEKYISDAEKNERVKEAYAKFKEGAIVLEAAYDSINVLDNLLLTNKNATRFEMEQSTDSMTLFNN